MSSFTPLTPGDVRRLAALARLELSEAETLSFTQQLGDILEFARQVQDAGTVPAGAGAALPPSPPLRDDEVRPSLARETALANAPDADPRAGLFKVPRVFNG